MPGPLSGIRILEVGHMLAGPYCGLILADLGAEVVKIESPTGDIARSIGPNMVGDYNVYFASLNRNKKSVQLDITDPVDKAKFYDLVKTSDALITNLRPAAIQKLGLTYEALQAVNEKIVCVALTGYGLNSPLAEYPAYDYVIQALTGIMAITGDPDTPPTKAGYSAVDNSAGLAAAVGLLAKIIEGNGGQIDVAMYDIMVSQLNYLAAAYLNAGEKPIRRSDSAHPYIVPAQLFQTRNGYLCLFVTHDLFWKRLADEVGKPEWVADNRFATMGARQKNRDVVIQSLQQVLLQDTTENWLSRLQPIGLVVSGVQSLEDALSSEHTMKRDLVVSISTADGMLRTVGNPIKFEGDIVIPAAPPGLGEHNCEVFSGSGAKAPNLGHG